MVSLNKFKTLIDLLDYFSNETVCREHLEKIRWNGELRCAYSDCNHNHVFKYKDAKIYKCAKCRRQFSIRVGTIFEDSKIPLRKWFAAIYLITSHRKGISSIQLSKDIGVQQKTAWFLLHRIRHTFGLDYSSEKLSGVCEADETFVGGAEGNKHKSKKTPNTQGRSVETKSAVIGVIERGGELRAKKIKNTNGFHLKPFVVKNIEFGSQLMTDEWKGYKGLNQLFKHKHVSHNSGEYVQGDCHTNSLEGFWSLLKRGIDGIYHSVSPKHLQNYIDEFVFRYNTRNYSESYRFDAMLNNINGHITYKQLISGNNDKKMEAQQGSLGF